MGLNQTFKIHYQCVPRLKEFQKDSSVTFAVRGNDRILKHIDWLLERYEARTRCVRTFDLSKGRAILCDLYLTCGFWIKSLLAKNPSLRPERYPAVFGLFEATTRELMLYLQCGRGEVERAIEEMYGRTLSEIGILADEKFHAATYMTETERQIYRLWFRGGRAYQFPWWDDRSGPQRVLAESNRAYDPTDTVNRPDGQGGTTPSSPNFGGFVMTMDREVFMAKHSNRKGIYHSSYTAGKPVIMAGTMLIEAGVIKAVRSDSGHYWPNAQNVAALLQGLSMYGVSLRRIQLLDHLAQPLANAEEFMASHMTWESFKKQRQDELEHRDKGDKFRATHVKPPTAPVPAAPPVWNPAPTATGYGTSPQHLVGTTYGQSPNGL